MIVLDGFVDNLQQGLVLPNYRTHGLAKQIKTLPCVLITKVRFEPGSRRF